MVVIDGDDVCFGEVMLVKEGLFGVDVECG